uniref:Ig-like domain-containing protein n=1 Tax=Equus caballus TaxID=9796 RepID=A0A3Q2IF85_HORSE
MKTQIGVLLGLLWIQIRWVGAQMKVEQSPGVLILQEGSNASLMCNCSNTMTSVQWFQQNPGGPLISLFYMTSQPQEKGRLKSTISTKDRYSHLYIRDSQPGDSATYICAVEHSALQTPAACTETRAEDLTQPPEGEQGPSVIRIVFPLPCIS